MLLTITQNKCAVCGSPFTEKHHVFYGPDRKTSESHGFVCWLCPLHHRGQPQGIHGGNKALDLELKKHFQIEFEKEHSREEFMKLIGRNFL